MSKFLLSITRDDGHPVVLRPGARAEHDLVESIVDRIMRLGVSVYDSHKTLAQGVGLFRTEAHVKEAIAKGFLDERDVRAAVTAGVQDAIRAVKSDVVPN